MVTVHTPGQTSSEVSEGLQQSGQVSLEVCSGVGMPVALPFSSALPLSPSFSLLFPFLLFWLCLCHSQQQSHHPPHQSRVQL